jgi:hypothetical protein
MGGVGEPRRTAPVRVAALDPLLVAALLLHRV